MDSAVRTFNAGRSQEELGPIIHHLITTSVVREPGAVERVASPLCVLLIREEVARFQTDRRGRRPNAIPVVVFLPVLDRDTARDVDILTFCFPDDTEAIATRVCGCEDQGLVQIMCAFANVNVKVMLQVFVGLSNSRLGSTQG